MEQSTAILGLLTETSLHAGAGQILGVIDLPIQREAHTDWPVVFGSAVKGALRSRAEDLGAASGGWVSDVFGPPTRNSSENAGALLVADARLLLLPIRSLTTHFKWVTCPALLRRFFNDRKRLGFADSPLPVLEVSAETALVLGGQDGSPLFLLELRLSMRQEAALEEVIAVLARLMGAAGAEEGLRRQLAVVDDDLFSYLARYATAVNAHVALDRERKTVKGGALWYEESLPPDTLLYACLVAHRSRRKDSDLDAKSVLARCTDQLFAKPYLQLGGNETVGMGWCRVAINKPGA